MFYLFQFDEQVSEQLARRDDRARRDRIFFG
jgi:hypothetical protein